MKKTLITLSLIFSMSLLAQEAVTLRIKLQKGDKYLAQVTTKFKGAVIKDMTNYEILTVKDATKESYMLELDIDKIVANLDNMGTPIHYDSSMDVSQMSQQAKVIHTRYKPQLNTVISEKISNVGKRISREKVSGQLTASMAKQRTNLIEFPERVLKIGDKWTDSLTTNNIKTVYTYTVMDITSTSVSLNVDAKLLNVYTQANQGFVKGNIEIDKVIGIPFKKKMQLNINVNGQNIQSEVLTTIKKV